MTTVWTLFDDLNAFLQEHHRCGALETGVENGRVWVTCECGAGLSRSVLCVEKLPVNRTEAGRHPRIGRQAAS